MAHMTSGLNEGALCELWCYHGTTFRIGVKIFTSKKKKTEKNIILGSTTNDLTNFVRASENNWPLLTLCEARNEHKMRKLCYNNAINFQVMACNRNFSTTEDDPAKNGKNEE